MGNGTVVRATFSVTLSLVFCATAAAQGIDFHGWEARPGLYFHILQSAELWAGGTVSVQHSPVRDHVSGVSALRLTFKKSSAPAGIVVYRPPGFVARARQGFVGISFWIKGDGSAGVGVLGIGEGRNVDPRAVFFLKSRTWQPVRLRWENFNALPKVNVIRSLHFSVTDGTKRPVSYLIDRIRLIRSVTPQATDSEVRKEGAKAAKLPDVPRPTDLSKFISGAEKLSAFRAKLAKAKHPTVKVLVVTDAVSENAGLWNIPPGEVGKHVFPGVLESELKRVNTNAKVVSISTEGPADADSRVRAAILRDRPDLVVVQFSYSAPTTVRVRLTRDPRKAIRNIFSTCRRHGVPAIAMPIPALPDRMIRTDTAGMLREVAAGAGIPIADFGALAAARGVGFEGEYYSTPTSLNVQGHRLAGQLLASVSKKAKPVKDAR